MIEKPTEKQTMNDVLAAAKAGWDCIRDNASRLEREADELVRKIAEQGVKAGAFEAEIQNVVWLVHTAFMIRFHKEMDAVMREGIRDAIMSARAEALN